LKRVESTGGSAGG